MAYRSALEPHAQASDAEGLRARLIGWIDAVGLYAELEDHERVLLETPVGKADEQATINAYWRSEGVAVLAWALRRFELPPYDRRADPLAAADGVGFADVEAAKRLLRSATLRPASEIEQLAAHATIVHWRIRSFPDPELMQDDELRKAVEEMQRGAAGFDFAAYLEAHPTYKDTWLEGLRFVDGDLAIGDRSIANASASDFQQCRSIAIERHVAAYWLEGDNETYSLVSADTILFGR